MNQRGRGSQNQGGYRQAGGNQPQFNNNNNNAGYNTNNNQGYQPYNNNNNFQEGTGQMWQQPQQQGRNQQPRKQWQRPSNRQKTQAPPSKMPDALPMGKHLSKTTSELKNDPLYLEAFMPSPSMELVAIANEPNHFPGFEGLPVIIRESYDQISSRSPGFKKNVSESAYSYYVAVAAWARALYLVKANRYSLTNDERTFIDTIYSDVPYLLPKSVSLYLAGFGNFTIPSCVESKFKLKPYTYTTAGYFENFATNYYLSASYPNLAIFAQRVVEDIGDVVGPWLPNGEEFIWNNRCIGYADAIVLPAQQRAIFQSANITNNDFPSECDTLIFNTRLVNSVSAYLSEVRELDLQPIPTNIIGSVGQMIELTTRMTHSQVARVGDIGAVDYFASSTLSCQGSASYLGGAFIYRIRKSELTPMVAKFYFPYVVNAPTPAQIASLAVLEQDWPSVLTAEANYETTDFKPSLRMKKICEIDCK